MTNEQVDDLLKNIEVTSQGKEVSDFVKKFRTWRAFFEQISKLDQNTERPKNYAIVFALHLVVLCGMVESWEKGKGSSTEKVGKFLSVLTREEKLLFTLAFDIKRTNAEHNEKFQEYTETSNPALPDELHTLWLIEDKKHDQEIEAVLRAYLSDDSSTLESVFLEKANFLYRIRSKIVHDGSPDVIGTMLMSGLEIVMYYGEKGNDFFTMENILNNLDEVFLRALCRHVGVEIESIDRNLENFLYEEFSAAHAPAVGLIVTKLHQRAVSK